MNNTHRGRLARRAVAAIGAVALGLLGSVAVASGASAAEPDANMPTGDGTLTIHKYEQPTPAGAPGTGNSIDVPSTWVPLEGVTFDIQRITSVDLTDNADWLLAEAYATDPSRIPPADLAKPVSVATDEDGVAGPATLPIGAYLVTEKSGPASIVAKSAPFVVTIPLPDAATGAWITDVHVYPKNSVSSITKTVDGSELVKVGDVVPWTVTVKIPQLAPGQTLSSFSVSDTFDTRLGISQDDVVEHVLVDGVSVDFDVVVDGQKVTVTPDLAAVNAKQGKDVEIRFITTVKEIGDGTIKNQAFVHLPGDVTLPSNEPFVKWGAVKIVKSAIVNGRLDSTKPLKDAEFALYATEQEAIDALAGTVGDPIWQGTTPANGQLLIDGLFVGDSNDKVISKDYYLVETKAPAGYDGSDEVIKVTVVPGSIAQAVVAQVGNTQKPSVELPLTGSEGTVALTAGGIALIALAAGAVLFTARRRQGLNKQ